MIVRERCTDDDAQLAVLYDSDVPELSYERVIVEDGRIVGHAGIRMVPEAVMVLAKGHPAARMRWLRALHCELLRYLIETGYKRVICLVAPKIERSFLRRLRQFGWLEGCQSAIFLSESDERQRGQTAGTR